MRKVIEFRGEYLPTIVFPAVRRGHYGTETKRFYSQHDINTFLQLYPDWMRGKEYLAPGEREKLRKAKPIEIVKEID